MEQWRGLHTISTSVLATLHPSHRCRGRFSQVCSTLQHQQDNSHRRFSFDASLSSAVHQVSLLLRCWGGIQLLLTAFFSLCILISLYSLAVTRCTEGVIVPNSFPSQLFLFLLCFYFFLHILCLSLSMVTRYLFVYIYWSLDSPFFFCIDKWIYSLQKWWTDVREPFFVGAVSDLEGFPVDLLLCYEFSHQRAVYAALHQEGCASATIFYDYTVNSLVWCVLAMVCGEWCWRTCNFVSHGWMKSVKSLLPKMAVTVVVADAVWNSMCQSTFSNITSKLATFLYFSALGRNLVP